MIDYSSEFDRISFILEYFMKNYDWIVIGAGITGSALSYELAKQGQGVLLLEKDRLPDNATNYSYGGLAYWSGTTDLTRQLYQEGIEIHRNLSAELDADTEFRDLDLVLTINQNDNPQNIAASYAQFAIQPQLLDVQEACQLEPLLNPNAISGILRLPHAHINPEQTNRAYQQAFRRLGGELKIERVTNTLRQGSRAVGVATEKQNYYSDRLAVCAGGFSRALLQEAGISIPLYFTHSWAIATLPTKIPLGTLVMPATQQRFALEATARGPDWQGMWDSPSSQVLGQILDLGAIQFLDGRLILGQISNITTDAGAIADLAAAEAQIRAGIANILPKLANLKGTCHHCLVAFSQDSRPLVGAVENWAGIYLFSGFTSTLVAAPPLARRFARWVAGAEDPIMAEVKLKF
jgi:glycine/D-amino acid oxidase-like deaminating enzyme